MRFAKARRNTWYYAYLGFIAFHGWVHNEGVLKALFKLRDDELTFTKAIQIAQGTEEAARVAKEMVYGQTSKLVYKV